MYYLRRQIARVATPVVLERGGLADGFDFLFPWSWRKGTWRGGTSISSI
jgi:hypothetical protein